MTARVAGKVNASLRTPLPDHPTLGEMTAPTSPPVRTLPYRAELRAFAERVKARKDSGMIVPGKRVWLCVEALRALARSRSYD